MLLVILTLSGCRQGKDTEPTILDTQIVTSSSTMTVRETSAEWREQMEKLDGLFHHD